MRPLIATCIFFVFIAVGLLQCALAQDSEGFDENSYVIKGLKLTEDQVAVMEKELAANPNDIETRGILLSYYSIHSLEEDDAARQSRQGHILWLIENRCDSKLAGSYLGMPDPLNDADLVPEAERLWLKKIDENPQNKKVLSNAAEFMSMYDEDQAVIVLSKLCELNPNNQDWRLQLSQLKAHRAEGAEDCGKVLKELEESLALAGTDEDRFYSLDDMASLAFNSGDLNKAADYSNELLKMSSLYKNNWNYGNATFDAHTMLGRVALKKGDIAGAKLHLIEAGKTHGSPQLDSFGPSMDLAKELLATGETAVVIEYLESCKRFWDCDYGSLSKWIKEIKATGTTNFSPNKK